LGQFLEKVGFPLGKGAAETIGKAIWEKWGLHPEKKVPAAPAATSRVASTINLTIVLRDRGRPEVVTKVVRIPDN
jgi:hypothetical protein